MRQGVSLKLRSTIESVGLMSIVIALAGCAAPEPEASIEMLPLEERRSVEPAGEEYPGHELPEPIFPDVARENSPKGAQATVEYFWEGIDYVRQTGQAQPAASVSHYLCDVCTEFIFRWQQLYDAGATATLDGKTEVELVETQSFVEEDTDEEWTAILFNVTEPASDFYMDGELIEEERLEETTLEGWWAELVYDEAEERWQIEWIDQDDSLVS